MWELVKAGGLVMLPLVVCSIVAVAIMIERALRLQTDKIAPPNLVNEVLTQLRTAPLDQKDVEKLQRETPLGRVLLAGIKGAGGGLEYMTSQMTSQASLETSQLEKYLTTLGTIGYIGPLLGLLGTVTGIIEAFLATSASNTADPSMLMAGISQALITTAFGIVVAVPALVGHRFFQKKVGNNIVAMEKQAMTLVQALLGPESIPYIRPGVDLSEQRTTPVKHSQPMSNSPRREVI